MERSCKNSAELIKVFETFQKKNTEIELKMPHFKYIFTRLESKHHDFEMSEFSEQKVWISRPALFLY